MGMKLLKQYCAMIELGTSAQAGIPNFAIAISSRLPVLNCAGFLVQYSA